MRIAFSDHIDCPFFLFLLFREEETRTSISLKGDFVQRFIFREYLWKNTSCETTN